MSASPIFQCEAVADETLCNTTACAWEGDHCATAVKGDVLPEIISKLTRQAARWSTAANQDNNSLIQVLHANYGAGYLWALKDIATGEDIKKATGIDILEFEKEIVRVQDEATKKMAKLCPEFAPELSYLTSIGGEG